MPDALDNAVRRTRRQLALRKNCRVYGFAVAVTLSVFTILILLGWWPLPWQLLAGLGVAIGALFYWLARRRVTDIGAALWLDAALGMRDLLPTALQADGMARAFLRKQASDALANVERWPTPHWPVRVLSCVVLASIVFWVVGLLSLPPQGSAVDAQFAATTSEPSLPTPPPTNANDAATPTEANDADASATSEAGDTATPASAAAAGMESAETDTLNVTTPRRAATPAPGTGPPGTGSTADAPGNETSNAQAGNEPAALESTSAPNINGNTTAPTVPPHLRDLVDAYFR